MSARARKQAKMDERDSERLRFLIDCMTREELIRHSLMRDDQERPSNLQLRRAIDAKRERFYKAHRRLTGRTHVEVTLDELDEMQS